MQVVIEEEKIIDILETEWGYEGIREDVPKILRENGTVLPKGHGRLLDENEILKKDNIDEYADWCGGMHEAISLIAIHNAPTVLEADESYKTMQEMDEISERMAEADKEAEDV